jgi:hypothetical protein
MGRLWDKRPETGLGSLIQDDAMNPQSFAVQ